MNLKTTIVLALLVGAGAGAWYWLDSRKTTEAAVSPTSKFLENNLTADKITRVEVARTVKPISLSPLSASVVGSLESAFVRQGADALYLRKRRQGMEPAGQLARPHPGKPSNGWMS